MATPLVRSIARAALARGNVVRAISTSSCLSRQADDIMEKWPADSKLKNRFIVHCLLVLTIYGYILLLILNSIQFCSTLIEGNTHGNFSLNSAERIKINRD